MDDRDDEVEEEAGTPLANRIRPAFGVPLILVLIAATVLLVIAIYPHGVVEQPNAGLVDEIFANSIIILAARIVLLFVAGYAVVSVVGLVARGQFLTGVGPFHASPVRRLGQDAAQLRRAIAVTQATIARLEERLAENESALKRNETAFQRVLDLRDTIERPGGDVV